MILNTTYFQSKELFIPNAIVQPSIYPVLATSPVPSNIDGLNDFIADKESECLIKALGYVQYEEFISWLDSDGVPLPMCPQKWIDLLYGVDFNDKRWDGLTYNRGAYPRSLLAYYVYFYYLDSDFESYTTTGIVVSNSANSRVQSPAKKMTKVWNNFVEMYNYNYGGHNYEYYYDNRYLDHWFRYKRSNLATLQEYLGYFPDSYDSSHFVTEGLINSWGI